MKEKPSIDAIVTKEELLVNSQENFDEISLDSQDITYTFTTIPNNLIRDETISPNCRWLIIFLLSNKPGWTIKSKQLSNHTRGFLGRDAIRRIMNEAIEAGYMERKIILRSTARGKLRGYVYKVASTPKFKKSLRQPEIQDIANPSSEDRGTEIQGPEDTSTKEVLLLRNTILKTNTSLKVPEEPSADAEKERPKPFQKQKIKRKPQEFPADVQDLANLVIQALMKYNPDYRPPSNLERFLSNINLLLHTDARTANRIMQVLEWALADNVERENFSGWSSVMYSKNPPETLRKHFSKISRQMDAKPKRKFAPCSDDKKSLEKMKEWAKTSI